MDPNPIRLETLSFEFREDGKTTADVRIAGHSYRIPIGLNGCPQLSSEGPFGLPFAAKGKWQPNGNFLWDLDTVAGINHYSIEVKVEGSGLLLNINEITGELKNYLLRGHQQSTSSARHYKEG